MLLCDHPELKPWPPWATAFATVGPPPTDKDIPSLRIRNIRYSVPARIQFVLIFRGGDCLFVKDFEHGKFAVAINDSRNKLIGKTLQEAGNVDIP